jgi:hypothetical protein
MRCNKHLLIAFCFLLISLNAYSQSVFTYDLKLEKILFAAALGVFTSSFFVNNEPADTPTGLDKKDVNMLDRSLMFSYNKSLDTISDYSVYGFYLLPLISLAGNIKEAKAWLTYGIMYAQAFCFTGGTIDLLKNAVIRYRPHMYNGEIPDGKTDDYYNSFPSGSTTFAFLSAGFLSATFSAEYPDSKWRVPIIAGAYTLATGVAACRIISGSHFLTDVLAGVGIGSLYGWVIPILHKRQNENIFSFNFTGNGFIALLKY